MKYEKGSFITVPSRDALRGLNPIAQSLYMWLCAYANETGQCFPSRKTLAFDVGCSEATIDRMVALLIEKGLLKKKHQKTAEGDMGSNLYTVLIVGGGLTVSTPSPHTEATVPSQVRTNSIHITQPIERGATRVISYSSEESEQRPPRVIPSPYSIEVARESFMNGERRLQVLNWYMDEKGLWKRATTSQKLKAIMQRHNSAAVRIANADWSLKEIREAKRKICFDEAMDEQWTLESIEKGLTK